MSILDEISGTGASVSDYGSNLSVDVNVNSVENFIGTDIFSHEEGNYGTIFDFDVSQRLTWPCSEVKDVGVGETCQDIVLIDETIFNPNDPLLACSTQQNTLLDKGVDEYGYFGAVDEDYCNSCLYVMNWQEMISPYWWPHSLSGEPQKGLPITLVLDLDETLVHSSFDSCKDADFSFSIHSQMQVQTVFVRQRPYLQIFLEAVARMFDIVIFTAGHSIYAKQLLDILDPNQTLIRQRVYRDSCVFTDGGYLKDLTILGRDLARIAIVDNTPQVFQLQVENGIPIESWFGDPSDSALLSLLFFLETLIGTDDVRPIIKKKFGCNANP